MNLSPEVDRVGGDAVRAGIILFGHGARNPQWAEPMERMRAWLQAQPQAPRVALAFLEFIQPDLSGAVAALRAQGVEQITVVPVFLARGGHLQRDLPAMLGRLQEQYPAVDFRLAGAAGEDEAVVAAIAGYALHCASVGTELQS